MEVLLYISWGEAIIYRGGGGEMKLMSLGREVSPQREKNFPLLRTNLNDLRDLHFLVLHEDQFFCMHGASSYGCLEDEWGQTLLPLVL